MQTVIKCQKLSYQVQGKALINQLNCEFTSAKIHVVLGKNGAGKSTLLALLSKELQPIIGSVFWQNKPLAQMDYADLAQQRAVLPQLQSPAFSISVQELVELGAQVQQGINAQQIKEISQIVMQACDVVNLAQRDVMQLSGGEQKRAQLARVLAQIWPIESFDTGLVKPFKNRWLFLDEWTNNLDLHHQQSLAHLFKQLASQGLGIIMVLHDINLCAQIADDVLILNQGQLFKQGKVTNVLTAQTIQQALNLDVQITHIEGFKHPFILPKNLQNEYF
ncbi:heme ABC transporter ATP-binding protein [Thiomicrorhabdus hydrogeniphila]